MKRQCAWCLRLIDCTGAPISPLPLPKIYDATHGICGVCGKQWMEQAAGEGIAERILQLQTTMPQKAPVA